MTFQVNNLCTIDNVYDSSLEDNKIVSDSDVKEVEVGFEIKEGCNAIDKPVIKILFD